jgi:hypothetical protein
MTIKLSQGLLSSLGGARGAQQPSGQPMGSGLLQPAMSSNPLVNTLVRSVGQARGMDMRTPGEIATQAMSQIGQDDPERLRKIVEIQLQAAVRAGDTTNAAKYANVLENIRAQEADKAKLATPKVVGSQTQYLRDTEGNNYARVMAVDEKGVATFEIQALGNAPEKPVGKLSPTEGGFTIQEQVELARQEAEAQAYGKKTGEQFAEIEGSILSAGLAAADELPKLDQVLDIVNNPDFSSGSLAKLISQGKQIFGVETADIGRFNKETADILLKALDNFKGAISEGERAYLKENLAGMDQSPAINRALLQDARDILERARQRAEYYTEQKAKGKKWDFSSWFEYVNEDFKQGYKGRPKDIVAVDTGQQPNNGDSSEDPQAVWDAYKDKKQAGQMNRGRGN